MPKIALIEAVRANNIGEVRRLLAQEDVDPQAVGGDDKTALMVAASMQAPEILEALAACERVNINFQNTKHETALLQAVWAGNCAAVEKLVYYLAKVNYQKPEGEFALFVAVSLNRLDMVKALVKVGANVCMMQKDLRAIDVAIQNPGIQADILFMLFEANKNQTKFIKEWEGAIKAKNFAALDVMVSRNIHRTLEPELVMQACQFAVDHHHLPLVSNLLVDLPIKHQELRLPQRQIVMVNGSIHNPEVLLIPDLVKQEQHCFSEIFQIYLQARAQGSRAAQITNRTTFGGSFQSRSLRELQGIASVTGIVQCVIQKARKHANARTTAEELKGRSASYRTLLQLSEAIETDIEEQADAWGLRLQLRRGLIDNGLAAIHQQCKVFEIEAKLAGGGDGAPREEGKCVV